MNKNNAGRNLLIMVMVFGVSQIISYFVAPESWRSFTGVLPRIISMIAFWGPIIIIVAFGFVSMALRMLGFKSFEDVRRESVEKNNPAPAIIFTGTLIASILFLMVVIKP